MKNLGIKLETELMEQLLKYSIAKNISKTEAVRRFIKQGIDNKIPENKLKEELKSIKQELSSEIKKQTERMVSLQVKNLMYTLINFHMFKTDIFIKAIKHDYSDVKTPEDANNFVDVFVNKAKKSAVEDKVDGLHSKRNNEKLK